MTNLVKHVTALIASRLRVTNRQNADGTTTRSHAVTNLAAARVAAGNSAAA
jgi:hypothetical protein